MDISRLTRVFYNQFPLLEIEDLLLREVRPESDANNYMAYLNHPEVAQFIPDNEVPTDINRAFSDLKYWHGLFYQRYGLEWAITTAQQPDVIIGTVGISNLYHLRGELHYDVAQPYWGQGIATKAVRRVIEFAREEMGLLRIFASVATHNHASIHILEKHNFEPEGKMKAYNFLRGKPQDYYLYALIGK